MDNQKFGRFIRDLRKKANMTQKELGEKLNVTDKAVSKWERGLGFPDISIINLLAETFGITASEVLNAEIGKKDTIDVEKAVQEAVESVTKEKEKKENRKRKLIKIVKIVSIIIFVLMFFLQLDLSVSKMDNEDRAKDIKDKMDSCIARTWRFLWKSPFWYKNITIKKWHKEIIVDKLESKIVKEIFSLRLENKAFSTIANILKLKYWNKVKLTYSSNWINRISKSKFYYWVFSWSWKEIIWTHKAIITKELYDKVNSIWKWVHQKEETIIKIP